MRNKSHLIPDWLWNISIKRTSESTELLCHCATFFPFYLFNTRLWVIIPTYNKYATVVIAVLV